MPAGTQAPLYVLGWGSTQTMDADAALCAILASGEPYSTVAVPELDGLLTRARHEMEAAARRALYAQAQRLVAEQALVVSLYQEDALFGLRSHVRWTGRADARIPVYDILLD